MLLQADPTVIYGMGPAFDGNHAPQRPGRSEQPLQYLSAARPAAGAICSFGTAALASAVNPEAHDFLYFVAKTDGGEHVFSTTLTEHNRAVRQYLQNRRGGR